MEGQWHIVEGKQLNIDDKVKVNTEMHNMHQIPNNNSQLQNF